MVHVKDEMSLTDKGNYIIEWGSMLRDIAGLFLEGLGLVVLGHFISIVALMMVAGVMLGLWGLHVKSKHMHKR